MPIGLVKGLLDLANTKSRDIQNKRKFDRVVIDRDCCLSNDTTISPNCHILTGCTINHTHIGSYTYVNKNTFIQHAEIGSYCSISHDVTIGLGAHPLHMFSTSTVFYKQKNTLGIKLVNKEPEFSEYSPILIGSDVWIGSKAMIMDGVTIGHGAVVAAGAIVTKDIPPYAIVAGVPAKIIKYRFSEETRLSLLNTKWWEYSPEDVYSMQNTLQQLCNEEVTFSK